MWLFKWPSDGSIGGLVILQMQKPRGKEGTVQLEGAESKLAWFPGLYSFHHVTAYCGVLGCSARGSERSDRRIIWTRSVTPIPSRNWKFKRQGLQLSLISAEIEMIPPATVLSDDSEGKCAFWHKLSCPNSLDYNYKIMRFWKAASRSGNDNKGLGTTWCLWEKCFVEN